MKTYEQLVEAMNRSFTNKIGYSPDEASDIGIRIRVLAGELYNIQTYLEWIKRQAFPQTAQGEYLDYHAQLRGLQRKPAVKAKGMVLFALSEPATVKVEIPQGTLVSTTGEKPVSFQTTQYGSIDVGKSTAYINAEAVEGGTSGNVMSRTINVIVTMPVENMTVTNLGGFSSGADSEDDETLRKRIIESFKYIENGTNRAYYESLAKTVNGVECVNVVPRRDGTNIVNIYISGKEQMLGNTVIESVQQLIEEQREINVDVRVKAAEILECIVEASVTLNDGYNIDSVQEELGTKLTEILNSYNVGQSLDMAVINDLLYHSPGVKSYEILRGTTGITARENEKIAFNSFYLREAS